MNLEPALLVPDALVTVLNLRDCGGLPARGGLRMKPGILFRSGNLEKLSNESYQIISGLHLQTIIDFRAKKEQDKSPVTFLAKQNISLPCEIDQITRDRLRPFLMRRSVTGDIIGIIDTIYKELADLMVEPVGQMIRIILNTDNHPVLIHCQGGKDRTGFAAAIIQRAMGVDPEIIIGEYLKSNEFMYEKIKRVKTRLSLLTLGLFPKANLDAAFEVKSQFLNTAFSVIETKYGGLDGYFAASGITRRDLKELENILLTKHTL